MKTTRTPLLAALLATLPITFASAALAADIEIKAPWVRGTVTGQKATGAFMEVTSKSGVTVVGVSSPVAGVAEIHEMKMDGGVMKMRAMPRLDIPAGKAVNLAPGGYHVMLMDLKQQMKKGEMIPLTLQVENKDKKIETVEVKAEVRDLTATTAPTTGEHKH